MYSFSIIYTHFTDIQFSTLSFCLFQRKPNTQTHSVIFLVIHTQNNCFRKTFFFFPCSLSNFSRTNAHRFLLCRSSFCHFTKNSHFVFFLLNLQAYKLLLCYFMFLFHFRSFIFDFIQWNFFPSVILSVHYSTRSIFPLSWSVNLSLFTIFLSVFLLPVFCFFFL